MKHNFSLAEISTYQSGVIQSNAQRAMKNFTDACLSVHDITTMQWFILGTLLDAGPKGLRVTDLAKSVMTTVGYLTNTLNLLEAKGMVVRTADEIDSRTKMVSVAKSFVPKCEIVEKDLRQKMRESIYATITPQELTTYIKVLYKLSALETS